MYPELTEDRLGCITSWPTGLRFSRFAASRRSGKTGFFIERLRETRLP